MCGVVHRECFDLFEWSSRTVFIRFSLVVHTNIEKGIVKYRMILTLIYEKKTK